ncbi:hypothetical protein ACLOJK_013127 [Asimina triloba]
MTPVVVAKKRKKIPKEGAGSGLTWGETRVIRHAVARSGAQAALRLKKTSPHREKLTSLFEMGLLKILPLELAKLLLFQALFILMVSASTHHRSFVVSTILSHVSNVPQSHIHCSCCVLLFAIKMVQEANYTRLCETKSILTVNGQYPGPTIYAHKFDTVIVKVYNKASINVTLHWHGVKQFRNPWSDGPEYITQCPLRPGTSFAYELVFTNEEGTVWWHAHSDWTRATVHGVIIVRPPIGKSRPYKKPYMDVPIILGNPEFVFLRFIWTSASVGKLKSPGMLIGPRLEIPTETLMAMPLPLTCTEEFCWAYTLDQQDSLLDPTVIQVARPSRSYYLVARASHFSIWP